MAIVRVEKDRENPFIVINKSFVYDNKLSLKAKGLMSYFLSRPNHWEFYVEEIKKHTIDKDRAISSAINELIKFGYIEREQKRNSNGRFGGGYDYVVYEIPQMQKTPKRQNAESVKHRNDKMPNRQNDVLVNNDFKVNNDFNNNKEDNPLKVYINNIIPTPGIIDIETLNDWTEKVGADMVIYAINIATKANVRRLNYIEKILIDWERNAVKTVEQAEAYTASRNKKNKKNADENNSKQNLSNKPFDLGENLL
ncbi:DnaD domain protein [Clostridium botulinum C]|uniref:Replication initiation and membrane attachment protein n=1 Tax=Clostridium novyi B str. ATCC 27606 TaxID=1443123 RepID=A0AA40M1E0_CLONO|nr:MULTISPECIES: DnaD domain protein [Clostridium]KEI08125.1 putative replication initiation and membrane attachment protein [Clostridium novyi B str. NCTC 9691]KEI11466.1 putative replication initiation and membrane attachment protein [Clostridium novyi B str. ATCC 27606]MCD3207123.1 DnaD domain protein [Clostridium botulinum C]MCD3209702.1 DnaD domain protein [Clostridium botulinum C]MCD3226611.1 DnaD domain protein [Clostridium botulinum C]